jgi:hypothetical protein
MSFVRPAFAVSQRRFGRGPLRALAVAAPEGRGIGDDLRLFAATFAAGFLFVSILIG